MICAELVHRPRLARRDSKKRGPLQSRQACFDDDDIVIAKLDRAADIEAAANPFLKAFSQPLAMLPHRLKRPAISQLYKPINNQLHSDRHIQPCNTLCRGARPASNPTVSVKKQGARTLHPHTRARVRFRTINNRKKPLVDRTSRKIVHDFDHSRNFTPRDRLSRIAIQPL